MPKKIRNMTGVVAGLAALALGGSALAGAAQHAPAKASTTPVTQESTSGPDTGNGAATGAGSDAVRQEANPATEHASSTTAQRRMCVSPVPVEIRTRDEARAAASAPRRRW